MTTSQPSPPSAAALASSVRPSLRRAALNIRRDATVNHFFRTFFHLLQRASPPKLCTRQVKVAAPASSPSAAPVYPHGAA